MIYIYTRFEGYDVREVWIVMFGGPPPLLGVKAYPD